VQVIKSAVVDPNGYNKVVIAGAAPDVYLATQMIQEVRYTSLTSLNFMDAPTGIHPFLQSSIHPACDSAQPLVSHDLNRINSHLWTSSSFALNAHADENTLLFFSDPSERPIKALSITG
jgi:hypothetical protein